MYNCSQKTAIDVVIKSAVDADRMVVSFCKLRGWSLDSKTSVLYSLLIVQFAIMGTDCERSIQMGFNSNVRVRCLIVYGFFQSYSILLTGCQDFVCDVDVLDISVC